MIKQNALFAVTLITCLILGQNVDVYIPKRNVAAIPPRQVQLEINQIVPLTPAPQGVTQETIQLAIPTDMEQTNNSDAIQAKIVDHNIQNLLQGRYLKNSSVIKSAQKVQEAMKPSVSFGDSGGVQHSVNLEVEAIQNVAKLNYSGYADTYITYMPREKSTEVSVSENISTRTKLSVEHKTKDDLSMLKLNFDW